MKSVQLFVMILLISFILYMIFHIDACESMEGFHTESYDSDEDYEGYENKSVVPSCYATVQKDNYLHYPSVSSDDYILKTKIVTPVCPNNPYLSMGSMLHSYNASFDPRLNQNTRSDDSTMKKEIEKEKEKQKEKEKEKKEEKEPSPKNEPGLSNNASITNFAPLSSPSNQFLLSPQTPFTPTPASKEDKTSKPETCPPCPACERCPEPVFDCKKVITYKDQQYPVPVIADFSAFSRF